MTIDETQQDGVTIVAPHGRIDTTTSSAVEEALNRTVARGARARGRLEARREPVVQFVHEALRDDVDARAHAHLLQEGDDALVLARVIVGQQLAHVARFRQPLAHLHAQ